MDIIEDFEIKLPIFEGPFDLLLFFIEKDELDIHNIPIAKITDDFLNYLHQLNSLNIELASEFIYVAATLMRIKAKMLLPRHEVDEAGNEVNLKMDLVKRLIEYKRFKEISEAFKILEANRLSKIKRGNIADELKLLINNSDQAEDLSSINLYKIFKTYQRVMKNYLIKTEDIKHTIVKYPYSIEVQKLRILNLLDINIRIDFGEIASLSKDKVQFVYNFLAILEMLQQELINIQIGTGFNKFWIEQR